MKSIFFRIYMGALIAALLAGLAGYVSMQVVNSYRLSAYLNSVAGGTFTLIAEGAARHTGDKRTEWLQIIERVTDLTFEQINAIQNLSAGQQGRLEKFGLLIIPLIGEQAADIYVSLPTSEPKYLIARVTNINERLARTTALLVLNELGRWKSAERETVFADLKQVFGYPIARVKKSKAGLSAAQLRRLKRGDVFVDISDTTSSQPVIRVFAPFGNSSDVLTLGPIPLFDWYPLKLMLVIGVSILLTLLLATYLLITPLQRRLDRIASALSRMGETVIKPEVPEEGSDALTDLACQINALATRVQKLLASQQELTRAVSHELRTPVSRLTFRLALLKDENGKASQLEGMGRDLQDLNTLIDEILIYATLEQGEPQLQMEHFDLVGLLDGVEQEENLSNSSVIKVGKNIDQDTVVYADRYYLKRAIKNLLSNALRYAKTEVSFVYEVSGGEYYLIVRDDGPGIPAEQCEQILKPFTKLDSSRTHASGNYGLGLSIVDQIMCWHEGCVTVNRNRFGGADFTLRWPVANI
ncbi:MAG: ATP-binding protein [Pseudomonadales bacterium]